MNKQDVDYIVAEMVPAVIEYVTESVNKATLPLLSKIADLEVVLLDLKSLAPVAGAPGRDGIDADPALIEQMVKEAVGKIPLPQDGKSVDPHDVAAMVDRAVAALPKPADGRDGLDGKDAPAVAAEDVALRLLSVPGFDAAIAGAVETHLTANPPPAGRDGTDGKDGAPGRDGERGIPGERGEKGEPARDGRDGLPGVPGLPGLDGKDGKDGLGFDDLSVEHDGERELTLRFARGEQVKTFSVKLPIPLDRGVWKEGSYAKGDGVTHGGQFFIARRDTSEKPEFVEGSAWRLAVKKGRDGKDFRPDGERSAQPVKFR